MTSKWLTVNIALTLANRSLTGVAVKRVSAPSTRSKAKQRSQDLFHCVNHWATIEIKICSAITINSSQSLAGELAVMRVSAPSTRGRAKQRCKALFHCVSHWARMEIRTDSVFLRVLIVALRLPSKQLFITITIFEVLNQNLSNKIFTMMFIYITLSLILPVIALAYPPLDHEQHNPVIVRGAAATPEPTPLPWEPRIVTKQLQANNRCRNPLPDEVDGVLPDGKLVNPVIMPNLTDNSCWTKPNTTNIDPSSPYYKPDTCQVCAMQGGVGPNAWYAAWVRDANNTAVGDQPAVNLGPTTSIGRNVAFAAAGNFLTMGVDPNKDPGARSAVGMMWGYQPGVQSGSQTYFAPMTPLNSTNCTSEGGTQGDTVVYFQCHFYCGPAPAPEPLIGPVAERNYLEVGNPSISNLHPELVEERSQPPPLWEFSTTRPQLVANEKF